MNANRFLAVVFLIAGLCPVFVLLVWRAPNALIPVDERIVLIAGHTETVSFVTPLASQYGILVTFRYPNADKQLVCETGAKNFPGFGCSPSDIELNIAWSLSGPVGLQESGTSEDQTWGSASDYRFIRQVGTFSGIKAGDYRLRLFVRANGKNLANRDPRLLVKVSPRYLENEAGIATWGVLFMVLCFILCFIFLIRSRTRARM
jgi:hypothetical protein